MIIFRQLIDNITSTYSYLLADDKTRQAVLIDSVFEKHARDLALIRELELKLELTLETHVHADHVTGAWLMKLATGSQIAVAKAAGTTGHDRALSHGDVVEVGAIRLEVLATPGHTAGCLSFVERSAGWVFTGDALLIRGAGRTDFQQGSAVQLFRSVHEQIFTLPEHFVVYPAHDYGGRCASTIAEELAHNPRLGERVRERDFVGYMDNLGLPHPKKLAEAVPANLVCGKPEKPEPTTPDWGPVIRTFAGVLQIEPEWVHAHRDGLIIVDVREEEEVKASPLGVIEGSRVIPLSALRERVKDVPSDRPTVFVCPAGARSAIAAQIAERAGLEKVANVRGGLFEWQALGLPMAER